MTLIGWDGLRQRGITLHRITIHRHMKAGKFPRAVKQGDWRLSWVADEIDAWIRQRAEERFSKDAA